jgi:hypothetical protein
MVGKPEGIRLLPHRPLIGQMAADIDEDRSRAIK